MGAMIGFASCGDDGRGSGSGGGDGGVDLDGAYPFPDFDGSAESCQSFRTRSCYSGAESTRGVGSCRAGLQECRSQVWGECQNEIVPQEEDCLGGLGDEDCDGEINESGPSCLCVAFAWEPCYTGPASTRGVGACRDGQQVCSDDGLSQGACSAQTLPRPENCLVPFDEDCDGQVDACPTTFAHTYGDTSAMADAFSEWFNDVAVGANGDFVVGGTLTGSITIGGETYSNTHGDEDDGYNAFVASFAKDGTVKWAKRFSDRDYGFRASHVYAVAVGPSGEVAVGGAMGGTMDFGGGERTGPGLFVVVYEANGAHRFSRALSGGDSRDQIYDLALDAAGNVYLTSGGFDFGGGDIVGGAALASYDKDGGYRFSVGYNAQWSRMEVGSEHVVLLGLGAGENDFGSGPQPHDFVVAHKLDGTFAWGVHVNDDMNLIDVAVRSNGTVHAVGEVGFTPDWTDLPVSGPDDADLFMVELDAAGELSAVRRFGVGVHGPSNYGAAYEIEFTESDKLLMVGSYAGVMDLGTGPVDGISQEDHFVALLSPDLSQVHYVQGFGSVGRDRRSTLHVSSGPSDFLVLAGSVFDPIDFGTGMLRSKGARDAVVVGMAP